MSLYTCDAERPRSSKTLFGQLRGHKTASARSLAMLCVLGLPLFACSSGNVTSQDQMDGEWSSTDVNSGAPAASSATGGTMSQGAPTGVAPTPNDTSGNNGAVSNGQSSNTSGDVSSTTDSPPPSCTSPEPGASPLRRLTRFEFSNSVEALLNDTSNPGQQLPAELLGNGFGNDAESQPSSAFLIEQYANVAKSVTASASLDVLAKYDSCVTQAAPDEQACARSFITKFANSAFRRPLVNAEIDELVALQQTLQQHGDFKSSINDVIETILQSPDFLYRIEVGEPATGGMRRPTGPEMASRLSYFLWGGPPDDLLNEAAAKGELSTPEGVLAQAERLLEDPKARRMVQFFFDNLLPVNGLTDQTRDPAQFPSFSAQMGSLMGQETSRFLQHVIFEGEGTWDAILTAPYTFVNEDLAQYYGIEGVTGEEFRKVDLDTTKRLGLLTQASILTGTTVTNHTNPVRRGGFLLSHVLCVDVPLPPAELAEFVKPPEPYSGKTGRERYTAHSKDDACRTCHALLDPPGFALENYDAVGLWRDTENDVMIDASGALANVGTFSGPIELVRLISQSDAAYQCFAHQWQKFAYGRDIKKTGDDKCSSESLNRAFSESGHNIKQLLLDMTQTDGFLYLGAQVQ
jgi:hypothetical protein